MGASGTATGKGAHGAHGAHGRTLAIGLDSVDLKLIERWVSEGRLPFFASLLAECPLVRLAALSRVLQGSIWPSMLTGVSPGHHGLYYFSRLARGTYHYQRCNAEDVTGERFYMRLGAHGLRCAFVDLPTDLPQADFPGLQVVDWATEFQYWTFSTQPASLKAEMEARFGKHRLTDYGRTGDSVEEHRKLCRELEDGVSVKSAFVRDLLERDDLDLIVAVYGEPHKAGHFFWKYLDPRHPDHVPGDGYLNDAILRQYQLIDRELAAIAALLRPEDNLIVFADHGMQANYCGERFAGLILERLGLSPSTLRAQLGGGKPASRGDAVRRSVRKRLHQWLRRVAPGKVVSGLRKSFGAAAGVDWSKVRAFSLPTDRNTYIRLNVRGREPQGVVEPKGDYEETLAMIEREFRALVNGETGELAVEDVFRVQELYPGPKAVDLPDLAVLWSSEAPINVIESPLVGRLEVRRPERRSGNHRPEGFLLARGPAFRSGPCELRGDILQFAPTMLALYDVPRPDAYEMGPIDELFSRMQPVS